MDEACEYSVCVCGGGGGGWNSLGVLSRNRPKPNWHGNYSRAIHPQAQRDNTNWHCMVTHAHLHVCYRCLLSAGLVSEKHDSNYHGNWV